MPPNLPPAPLSPRNDGARRAPPALRAARAEDRAERRRAARPLSPPTDRRDGCEIAQRLLLREGRRKGYLTLAEVAAVLPEIATGERIAELAARFAAQGIPVFDAPLPRGVQRPPTRRPLRTAKSLSAILEEYGNDGNGALDPTQVYLRDMAQVALLTREGEIEIAQRIEAGIEDQRRAVLGTPFGLAEVLRLDDRLGAGQLAIGDLLEEGAESADAVGDRRPRGHAEWTQTLAQLRRSDDQISGWLAQLAHPDLESAQREQLRRRVNETLYACSARLRRLGLSRRRIDEIAVRLRTFGRRLEALEARLRALAAARSLDPEGLLQLVRAPGGRAAPPAAGASLEPSPRPAPCSSPARSGRSKPGSGFPARACAGH